MPDKDKIYDINDHSIQNTATQAKGDTDEKLPDADIQIINLYKKTMDNISMPQDKKNEIRADLESLSHDSRSRRKAAKIARYAAIAAAFCAVVLCIPATRTTVSAAIEYLKETFHLADGSEVTYEQNSESNSISFSITTDDDTRSVILIGGTPESCGWVELFFDKNGKYIFNNMNVEDYNDPWLDRALNAEGVDSGNPYLDDQLSSEASTSATYIQQ